MVADTDGSASPKRRTCRGVDRCTADRWRWRRYAADIFHGFVQDVGGRPDGLFKTAQGDYYKLWSLTVPFTLTSVAMLIAGLGWAMRFRHLKYRPLAIIMWLGYGAIL
jgi:hypothetical protein